MTTVREIVTNWLFKADTSAVKGFERALQGAKNTAKFAAKTIAGVAAAGLGAGVGIFKLTERLAEQADEMGKASARTGINTTMLQQLKYVATRTEVDFKAMVKGMKSFSLASTAAQKGGKAQKAAFAELGVSLKDNKGKLRDQNEVFLDTLLNLAEMTDANKRLALSTKLLGPRAAFELAPMFDAGAEELGKFAREALEAGKVLQGPALKAGQDMDENLKALRRTVGGVTTAIGVEMLPIVSEVIDSLAKWVKANKGMIVKEVVQFLRETVKWLREVAKSVNIGQVLNTATSAVKLFGAAIHGLVTIGSSMKAAWIEIKEFFSSLWDAPRKEFNEWIKFVGDTVDRLVQMVEDTVIRMGETMGSFIPGAKAAAEQIKAMRTSSLVPGMDKVDAYNRNPSLMLNPLGTSTGNPLPGIGGAMGGAAGASAYRAGDAITISPTMTFNIDSGAPVSSIKSAVKQAGDVLVKQVRRTIVDR